MLYSGADPASYITEYALIYEEIYQLEPLPCAIISWLVPGNTVARKEPRPLRESSSYTTYSSTYSSESTLSS